MAVCSALGPTALRSTLRAQGNLHILTMIHRGLFVVILVACASCATPLLEAQTGDRRTVADGMPALEPEIAVEIAPAIDSDDVLASIRAWVADARRAVEGYYGRFPVDKLRISVRANRRRGVGSATTLGQAVPLIRIAVHPRTAAEDFGSDWTLTHEMIHLALPSLADEHHWLEEGIATYVEPIARARAGLVSEQAVWAEWLRNYSQGLPGEGDRGLDHESSWGRTYYGGAIFCLLADVEIRARTDNRKSLRDALVAILASNGDIRHGDSIERLFASGDRATGANVLSELYGRMKDSPVPTELESTWKRLDVSLVRNRVLFDDSAPLANVRRALVLGR